MANISICSLKMSLPGLLKSPVLKDQPATRLRVLG
jgi:hypothetical protein